MIKISDVKLSPFEKNYKKALAKVLKTKETDILNIEILRKSLDCRKRDFIHYVLTFKADVKNEEKYLKLKNVSKYIEEKYVFPCTKSKDEKIVVAGSGPAGLFCCLMLARAGANPVILERGEKVEDRKKSVDTFFETGKLNINSNIQFGEGGAGTFSDGKLTCGLNNKKIPFINEEFVKHGAPDEIKYSSKPHIGTDYLYKTVKNIREEIISLGGTFLFETTLKDIIIKDGKVVKAVTDKGEIECDRLVLATGHSSRDTYKMLYEKGVNMEKKPFSVGVRIEHKREYINLLQYKSEEFAETLPAADYKLSCHSQDRGAYTFCMCPGGVVVCGASGEGQVVTNGMSYFARDKENSNAALLVSVLPEDIKGGVLDAINFQEDLERKAYTKGGENYFAPVQLVKDFLEDRESTKAGNVKPSYLPGVKYTSLKDVLPDFVIKMLKFAIVEFDRKMKGFNIGDAVLTGVETRSSAPLRILRDESFQSNIKGLYPIGEGAGYAGGIMSSSIDGINCAEAILNAQI